MKICYYPRYGIEGGSSRARVYLIQKKLLEWGIDAFLMSAPFTADIIVFQKTFSKFHCDVARQAKKKGIKIVFDLDDDYKAEGMINLSDIVTCDSWGLVRVAQSRVRRKIDGRVILNPIDYIREPLPKRIHQKKEILDIVYFANPNNFRAFSNCRPALEQLRKEGFKLNLTLIGGRSLAHIFQYSNPFKNFPVKHIPWSLKTFSENLRKFDISILPQAWDWKGPCKQVDSCAHQVPAVVEKIPPNEFLYKKAGLEEYLAGSKEEWYRAIKKLFDHKERNRFVEKVHPIVWKEFSIDKIAKDWLSLFEELVKCK